MPSDQPQLTAQITIRDGDVVLAQLNSPIEKLAAWRLYHEAIASMLRPTAIIKLPEKMSAEEAESFRASWGDRLKR